MYYSIVILTILYYLRVADLMGITSPYPRENIIAGNYILTDIIAVNFTANMLNNLRQKGTIYEYKGVCNLKGEVDMPNIKPISDLRNYTAVINEVTYGNRVYLTRNGHGECAIIDMKELDELDRQKALYTLMNQLNEAEMSIREEGTISADEMEEELGV